MNKYKKLASLTTAVAIIGMSNAAFADNGEQPAPTPENGISLTGTYQGEASINQDGDTNIEKFAGLELQMSDKFKANLAIDLERVHGALVDDEDFDWEAAVAEANITIDLNEAGLPVVLVAGKMLEQALKHTLSNQPGADEKGLQPNVIKQVIGVSAAITTSYLNELTVAVTETEGGDMSFNSDTIRMTVKAVKDLSATVTAVGTLAYEMNDIGDDGYAASAGLIFDISEMTGFQGLEAYGQGSVFDNFGGVNGTELGYEFGLNYAYNERTKASASYESFNNEDMVRLGASYLFKNGWTGSGSVFVKNIGKSNQSEGVEAMITIPTSQLFKVRR